MAAVFVALALLERLWPFRSATQAKPWRWFTNIALFVIDSLAVRLLVPVAMVGMAGLAAEAGWGVFNNLAAPLWVQFVVTILALDLALYVQHWATHRVPILWRMHRVHHADRDFDVTTAARFHPFEIVLSMIYKSVVVAALGAPAVAVFVFEVGFAILTLWTHANLSLPASLDRAVRRLVVTPDMHRIHHSSVRSETDSNYGTFLSGWDRLFETYTADARSGARGITIGLAPWQDDRPNRLGWSLLLPFFENGRGR